MLTKAKVGFGILILAGFYFVLASNHVFAQTANTEVLLNWRSQTYAPDGYSGKTLPTGNSWITATVDAIQNGKFVDLSNQNIYWYKDDQFIDGGVGLWQINIQAPEIPGDIYSLRVEIPGLGGNVLKTIDVPVVYPILTLDAPYPGNYVSGQKIKVSSLIYFFDIQNPIGLTYDWKVNGEGVKNPASPLYLDLALLDGTPDGFMINVDLFVKDMQNVFVGAKKSISLILKNN